MNVLRVLPAVLLSLSVAAAADAQVACAAIAPSGQALIPATMNPTCRNTNGGVAAVFGNPAFALHNAVVAPCVPPGNPMLLLLGPPVPPPLPLGFPVINPACGLPGWLAMTKIWITLPAGVSGTFGNPPVPVPIPPGLGAGPLMIAQTAVLTPGGIELSGATIVVL